MKIKRIKVEKLFGLEKNDFDITCYPNEHITILYAFNGTGKTTILKLVYAMLTSNDDDNDKAEKSRLYLGAIDFSRIVLFFDNGSSLALEKAGDNDNLLRYVINGAEYTPDSPEVKSLLGKIRVKKPIFANLDSDRGEIIPTYKDPFDGMKLKYNTSSFTKTGLAAIATLHDDIKKKASDNEQRKKLQEDYIDMLNENFPMMFKQLKLEDDSLKVELDYPNAQPLSLKQLSSGEQKLLLLFYELLFDYESEKSADTHNKEQTIVLIDEPETSLHITWMNQLVKNVMKICEEPNRDIQVLIATHSADIVSEYVGLQSPMISARYADE